MPLPPAPTQRASLISNQSSAKSQKGTSVSSPTKVIEPAPKKSSLRVDEASSETMTAASAEHVRHKDAVPAPQKRRKWPKNTMAQPSYLS
jgi:hypothetical protein